MSTVEKPRWVPVGEMVPEGSIGAERIAQIPDLGRRLRPETIFQQPLKSLPEMTEEGLTNLAMVGFMVVGDILSRPADEKLIIYPLASELEGGLDNYIRSLEILHETRFVYKLYGGSLLSVLPQHELEIVEGVKAVLSKVRKRYPARGPVLSLRFGLDDGITRTQEETGLLLEEDLKRIREKERKALRVLKQQPHYIEQLRAFLTLPEESIGRRAFDGVLLKDMPPLEATEPIHKLQVSSEVLEELKGLFVSSLLEGHYPTIEDLIRMDLTKVPAISRESELAIIEALRMRAVEIEERPKREAEKMARIEKQKWIDEVNKKLNNAGEPINNFLPERKITEQKFREYDYVPIEELGLSDRPLLALKRSGIITVGLVLRKEELELKNIWNFGDTSLNEVKTQLAKLLELDEEKWPVLEVSH